MTRQPRRPVLIAIYLVVWLAVVAAGVFVVASLHH